MYELLGDYHAILNCDDIDDLTTKLDTLDAAAGDIKEKLRAYRYVLIERQAQAKAVKELADKYAARAKSLNNQAAELKRRIDEAMILIGGQTVEWPEGKIFPRQLKDQIEIVDETQIAREFVVISSSFDKVAIATAIAEGKVVEGVIVHAGRKSFTVK